MRLDKKQMFSIQFYDLRTKNQKNRKRNLIFDTIANLDQKMCTYSIHPFVLSTKKKPWLQYVFVFSKIKRANSNKKEMKIILLEELLLLFLPIFHKPLKCLADMWRFSFHRSAQILMSFLLSLQWEKQIKFVHTQMALLFLISYRLIATKKLLKNFQYA